MKKTLRKWIYLSHKWIGLILGLYLTMLGLTGGMLVFKPELNNFFDGKARQVAVPIDGKRVPLDEVVSAFNRLHVDAKITSLVLAEYNSDAISILYKSAAKTGQKPEPRQCFVNPYNGAFLADETPGGDFFHFVKDLHTKLLLEDLGEDIHRYGVLSILVLLISGIWLWWPSVKDAWRDNCKLFWQHLRLRTAIKWDASFRRIVFDTHNMIGFYSSLLLLLFATTAITVLWRQPSMAVIATLTQSPVVNEKKSKKGGVDDVEVVSYNACIENAKSALPGLTPLLISPDGKVMMAQSDIHFVAPRLIAVKTNPQSGGVENIERPADKSLGQQIMNWAMPVHFGQWGPGPGYFAVKCLWLITGFCPLVLFISGFLMYLEKEKAKGKSKDKGKGPRNGDAIGLAD